MNDCHCITSNTIEVTYRNKCKLIAQVFLVVIDLDTLRLIDQSKVLISFVLNSSIFCHRTFQQLFREVDNLIRVFNLRYNEKIVERLMIQKQKIRELMIWMLRVWFVRSIFDIVKIDDLFAQSSSWELIFQSSFLFLSSITIFEIFENHRFIFWFNFNSNFFNHLANEKDVSKTFTFSIASMTMCVWKLIFIVSFFNIHSKFDHESYFENVESKSIISKNSINICLKIEDFVSWNFDNFIVQLRNWDNKFVFITNVVINLTNVESFKSFLMSITNFVS